MAQETGLSDHHHFIFLMMEAKLGLGEPKRYCNDISGKSCHQISVPTKL